MVIYQAHGHFSKNRTEGYSWRFITQNSDNKVYPDAVLIPSFMIGARELLFPSVRGDAEKRRHPSVPERGGVDTILYGV